MVKYSVCCCTSRENQKGNLQIAQNFKAISEFKESKPITLPIVYQ
jgi:hypothetical protein